MRLARSTRPRSTTPIQIVALQTAHPEPTDDGLELLRRHFCTGTITATLLDSGIRDRAGATRPESIRLLSRADLVLIGGGDPQRLHDYLDGTPAQEVLRQNWLNGAVIAGCSAGAAVLGSGIVDTTRHRPPHGSRLDRQPVHLWNWLHGLVVAPHFGDYDLDRPRTACVIRGRLRRIVTPAG